jgi:hypothetical protein
MHKRRRASGRARAEKEGEKAGNESRPEGDTNKRRMRPGRVECIERDGGQTEGT